VVVVVPAHLIVQSLDKPPAIVYIVDMETTTNGGKNNMTATQTVLNIDHLAAALEDDRHLGFGYATSRHLPHGYRTRLNNAVIAVANEIGLTEEELFDWSNSKTGRHLVDVCSGGSINREEVVRRFVHRVS